MTRQHSDRVSQGLSATAALLCVVALAVAPAQADEATDDTAVAADSSESRRVDRDAPSQASADEEGADHDDRSDRVALDDEDERTDGKALCAEVHMRQLENRLEQHFVLENDPDAATLVTLPVRALAVDGVYAERQLTRDDDGELVRELVELQTCSERGLHVAAHSVPQHGVRRYDPALLWVPLPLEPGSTWSQEVDVRVLDENGETVSTGTATLNGTVGEGAPVETRAGEFSTTRLTVEMTESIEGSPSVSRLYYSDIAVDGDRGYLLVRRTVDSGDGDPIELELIEYDTE